MGVSMMFLKLEIAGTTLKGTAENRRFQNQIVIDGVSWSASAKDLEYAPDGYALGKVEPKQLTIEKAYDSSSSALAQALVKRRTKKVTKATITMLNGEVVDAQGEHPQLAILVAEDGFIESIDLGIGSAGKAMEVKETIQISFQSLTLTYFPADLGRLGRGAGIDAKITAAMAD